jgi:hypothetical protein
LHRQVAVVECGALHVEVPLRQLMPDLGQEDVRAQIAALRKQILDQAGEAEASRAQARHYQQEYQHSLQLQKERARQFDTWLGAIARLKVGDVVPITIKPGTGQVVKVDLPGLRATILTGEKPIELSLQELFPQTGPFAPHLQAESHGDGMRRHAQPAKDAQQAPSPPANRPMPHARRNEKQAQAARAAILAAKPGQQVFVVPFHKHATLIRVNAEKNLAVVQAGIFEIEVGLEDVEPLQGQA